MRKDTRVHLVADIEALLKSGNIDSTPLIQLILEEARAGEYHDYKNEKYACGKVEVVDKLRSAGLVALAKRVMSGEFDEVADEEDKARMRAMLPKSMWPILKL